jgi:hypothetical protein
MKLKDLIDVMSCEEGYELFDKIEAILNGFNISVYHEDGRIKDLYEVCCDVSEVLNKEKWV